MIAPRLLLLFLAALSATAFQLPDEPVDGFYVAYINETGHEVHEPVAPGSLQLASAEENLVADVEYAALERAYEEEKAALAKRQNYSWRIWESWCGCGFTMPPRECDAAVADLKAQLPQRTRIEAGQAFYSIRGGAVAFACNQAIARTAVIDHKYITWSAECVTERCGRYIAGTAFLHTEMASITAWAGYMRYRPGLNFCKDSDSSPAKSCPK